MRRFQNKQNGRIVTLIEEQTKAGQLTAVSVQYEDDGKQTGFSASTWHRWWKEIEPVEDEDVAGDGTPYKEVMAEILQDEKKAAEKKQKKAKEKKVPVKKTLDESVQAIFDYINEAAAEIGATSYIRDKQPNIINYRVGDGKVLFIVHKTRTKAVLFVKSRQVPEKYTKTLETVNGFYDKKLIVDTLNQTNKSLITNIVDSFKTTKEEE